MSLLSKLQSTLAEECTTSSLFFLFLFLLTLILDTPFQSKFVKGLFHTVPEDYFLKKLQKLLRKEEVYCSRFLIYLDSNEGLKLTT